MNVPILILAAGGSRRMGKPKQFLTFRGKSLLQHAAEAALGAQTGKVYVVTGAEDKQIRGHLSGLALEFIYNPKWEEGIAGSIVLGLKGIWETAETGVKGMNGVIIMVADQPAVDEMLLKKLWLTWKASGLAMAACSYESLLGTPALFSAACFKKLLELKGDTGARKLLQANREMVAVVEFPEGGRDIDTPEDYERLLGKT